MFMLNCLEREFVIMCSLFIFVLCFLIMTNISTMVIIIFMIIGCQRLLWKKLRLKPNLSSYDNLPSFVYVYTSFFHTFLTVKTNKNISNSKVVCRYSVVNSLTKRSRKAPKMQLSSALILTNDARVGIVGHVLNWNGVILGAVSYCSHDGTRLCIDWGNHVVLLWICRCSQSVS